MNELDILNYIKEQKLSIEVEFDYENGELMKVVIDTVSGDSYDVWISDHSVSTVLDVIKAIHLLESL